MLDRVAVFTATLFGPCVFPIAAVQAQQAPRDYTKSLVDQYDALRCDHPEIVEANRRKVAEIMAGASAGRRNLAINDNTNYNGVGANASPQGTSHNYIRIYSVDLTSGTDVAGLGAFSDPNAYRMVSKTVLFESQSPSIANTLNTYDTKVDNVEGMSFGPTLADGRRSLVLVSDNNNSGSQR